MKINSGAKSAQALLDRLNAEGDLVDVYSSQFFARQPSYQEDPYAPFTSEGFDYLLDEYENNTDSDQKPLGHLLFIHVDDYKHELRNKLIEVYQPLMRLFDTGKHHPDFLILNLHTTQVLCIGLGRKNRLFAIDAKSGRSINVFGLLRGVHSTILSQEQGDDEYMKKFTEHDVYESVSDLVHALYKLGVAMYGYDGMPANLEQIEYSRDLPPNNNAVYELRDIDGNLLTNDEFSKEELIAMYEEIRSYQDQEDEAMKIINTFFPQCERGELNTGDY